jgi:hypothetical protein
MEQILTDGEQLADYTNRYFTEVEPIDLDEAVASYTPEYNSGYDQEYTPRYDQVPAIPANASAGTRAVDPQTQWQGFGNVMNQSPEQAWRYLSQMSPDAIRSKLLFMDQA